MPPPPDLDAGLVQHRAEPLNCETSIPALNGDVVTPNARFYVRNHFPTPMLDAETWRLRVDGLVERPLELSLRDLRRMPSRSFIVTLECAGNGRSMFDPPVPGEQWQLGAVSTAEWTGVPLVEVLDRARPLPAAREVLMRGADEGPVDDGRQIFFERSLSLEDVGSGDALLAYAMNGEPLPRQHGFPVRLIVPGWYAVTSVKWLAALELIGSPFRGFFQGDRYVYQWERDGEVVSEPVRLQQVRSVITEPTDGAQILPGDLVVRGAAWSGAAPVSHVEVRVDNGPWQRARLLGDRRFGRWQRWELVVRAPDAGPIELRARATDLAGRTQPDIVAWNRLGYGGNAIQVVNVTPHRA